MTEAGSPEPQPPTVGITARFDFTGLPHEWDEVQRQLDRAIGELGGTNISVETGATALQRCLEGNFDWLLQDLPPQSYSLTYGSLRSQGFRSVKDIFVMGASRLLGLDGVGPKTIDSIRNRAGGVPILDVPFKEEPTVEDMAAWCSHTDQIPAQVVMPSGFGKSRYRLVAGRMTIEAATRYTSLFAELGGTEDMSEQAKSLIADFWRLKGEVQWP